jgi:hypothetical protein
MRAADPLAQAQQRKDILILRHCCNGMRTRLKIPMGDSDIVQVRQKKWSQLWGAQDVASVVHRLPH